MSEWGTHADNGDWRSIHVPDLSGDELRELYIRLCAVVPKIGRENGLEQHYDFALPHELNDERLKPAALLLHDIRGLFEEEPKWFEAAEEYARQVLADLGKLVDDDDRPIDAHQAEYLSQEWHARRALELVDGREFILGSAAKLAREKPLDAEEVQSWMEELAAIAFTAGRHVQAALGKEFEFHAVRGMKIVTATRAGGEEKAKSFKRTKDRIFSAMGRIMVEREISARAAAAAAHFDLQLGTGPDANYRMWKREEKKSQKK